MKYYLLLIAYCLFSSCSPGGDSQPSVAVTIEPLRYFAEQIAGDRLRVYTLVPRGASPETYEPTARQMISLAKSELYIKVGSLGFERAWTDRIRANAPAMAIANASEGIELSPDGDPHTWTSPRNALTIAHNICRALTAIAPQDSVLFRQNHDKLCRRIAALDERIARQTDTLGQRAFLVYHPTLTYFARDYRLEQLAIESHGREPSAQGLRQLIAEARDKGVRLMFVQREFANRNTATVGDAVGARRVEIDPLSYHWEQEMTKTANALCQH